MEEGRRLGREFYQRDALTVAPELIGKRLLRRTAEGLTGGLIVEAEAYLGPTDAAAHSYRDRRTARTAVQYGPGGYAYVFRIYGMHSCVNVVVNDADHPEVILLRALEPDTGLALMRSRRGKEKLTELCSGPGKLCQALAITGEQYGADLCGETLWLEDAGITPPTAATERIRIDYAGEAAWYPWRFIWKGSPFLSVPPRE